MMGRRFILLAATMLAASAAQAKDVTSWGKAGVSFADYRRNAVRCATTGLFCDFANDVPARRFVRGFNSGENAINGAAPPDPDAWLNSVRRTQPDRQKRLLHAIQVGDVETCPIARGYAPFTLTRAERDMLARYKPGSAERHRYLHTLAER